MGSGTRRQLLVARPEQLWLLASARSQGRKPRGIYRRVRNIGVCSLRQFLARGQGRENRYLYGRSQTDPCGKTACRRDLDEQARPSRRHLPSDFGRTRGRIIRKRGANNVETAAGVNLAAFLPSIGQPGASLEILRVVLPVFGITHQRTNSTNGDGLSSSSVPPSLRGQATHQTPLRTRPHSRQNRTIQNSAKRPPRHPKDLCRMGPTGHGRGWQAASGSWLK